MFQDLIKMERFQCKMGEKKKRESERDRWETAAAAVFCYSSPTFSFLIFIFYFVLRRKLLYEALKKHHLYYVATSYINFDCVFYFTFVITHTPYLKNKGKTRHNNGIGSLIIIQKPSLMTILAAPLQRIECILKTRFQH